MKQILIAGRQRVRVPALMHRIGFDVDGIKKEIASEITVYPIYKQTAIEEAEFTDFTAAPTENGGVTYVRHRKNLFGDPEISQVRYNSGPTIIADAWEFIDVQFFADQACTIPKVVNNLMIKYRREYRGLSVLNYRNYFLSFSVQGTDANGIANLSNAYEENNSGYAHTEHYRRATLFKPKEYFTNKFFLEPSPTNDYIIVL